MCRHYITAHGKVSQIHTIPCVGGFLPDGVAMNDGEITALDFSAASFVKEAHRLHQLPPDRGAEIAFAGRSNAGKSSTINALCRRRQLARTSRTPGRTQRFVVYEFAPERRIVDLPGFGFAKVSRAARAHWSVEIPHYLETRRSLIGLILVADSRHALKEQERQILAWTDAADLPALLLLNKADKLKQRERAQAIKRSVADGSTYEVQLFSATAPIGIDAALATIASWFNEP